MNRDSQWLQVYAQKSELHIHATFLLEVFPILEAGTKRLRNQA